MKIKLGINRHFLLKYSLEFRVKSLEFVTTINCKLFTINYFGKNIVLNLINYSQLCNF